MSLLINELLAPENVGTGGATTPSMGRSEELTANELEQFLADESEDKPEEIDLKPEKKEKEDEDKEESDKEEGDEKEEGETEEEDKEKSLEEELEEDLAEPDEDKLETLVSPVKRREILAKYPNLFKEFPYLEHAYYREQKFTELFANPKDAQAASEKADTWDKFESQISDGNLGPILSALAEQDKNSFYKIADTIINTIEQIDEPTAVHIYSGIAKRIITMMSQAGQTQGQEQLGAAAHLMHQFLFGARPFEAHQPLHKPVQRDSRDDELSKRERDIIQRQFVAARDEIGTKTNNSIKVTIEKHIDPRGSMSEYVKGKAVDDVLVDVQKQMQGDKRFQGILTRLWQEAVSKDFDEASKQAIRSAVMSKAKSLLLPAIQKGRRSALGTAGRRNQEKEVNRPEKTGPTNKSGKSTSPSNRGNSAADRAKQIPRNVSTRDFLMGD